MCWFAASRSFVAIPSCDFVSESRCSSLCFMALYSAVVATAGRDTYPTMLPATAPTTSTAPATIAAVRSETGRANKAAFAGGTASTVVAWGVAADSAAGSRLDSGGSDSSGEPSAAGSLFGCRDIAGSSGSQPSLLS